MPIHDGATPPTADPSSAEKISTAEQSSNSAGALRRLYLVVSSVALFGWLAFLLTIALGKR